MSDFKLKLIQRPRRLRRTAALRAMAAETALAPGDLVQPIFVIEGKGQREPIGSMPTQDRLSCDLLAEEAKTLQDLGVSGIALFPKVDNARKDERGTEAHNDAGLIPGH